MKESIRQYALELGFDDCQFTTADRPNHARDFQQWLDEKRHGEMDYLQRNAGKRMNPLEVLPGAKSILALAVSYTKTGSPKDSSSQQSVPDQPTGVIARYARFKDYHDLM